MGAGGGEREERNAVLRSPANAIGSFQDLCSELHKGALWHEVGRTDGTLLAEHAPHCLRQANQVFYHLLKWQAQVKDVRPTVPHSTPTKQQ